MNDFVDIAIQVANDASAYAAKFVASKPTGKQLAHLHKLATEARFAIDAAWDVGGLSADDEWKLITLAAIPVETLIAVNVALLKDAKAAASTIRSLVAQAKDLSGVTSAARKSLDFVDGRAQLILAHKGQPGDLAPSWPELAGCASFWEPCQPSWILPAILLVAGYFIAKKYRLI